ncbi:MAG: PDZ domain-containing protein [Planctomycetes bacterium]|nr:PDZ domain-containing protein [Planctomycetota bacterium]
MDYRKHRPWIISIGAFAIFAVSLWFSAPHTGEHENDVTPAPVACGNTTGSFVPVPKANSGFKPIEPAETDTATEPDLPDHVPEPKDKPKYADTPIDELKSVISKAIEDNDVETIRAAYLELQVRGEQGLKSAVDLTEDLFKAYGYGDGADGKVGLEPWGKLESYLSIFTPELIRYAVFKTDSALPGMLFVQEIASTPGFSDDERIEIAGDALLFDDKRSQASWMKQSAGYALMLLPSRESVAYARKYLESVNDPENWPPRHSCVWVIARMAEQDDWEFIARVARNDPHEKVRETAEYHLKASSITEEGLYVMELDPDSAAAAAGVQLGDVILTAAGRLVEYTEDIEGLTPPVVITLLRDGALVDLTVGDGDMGIKGMHVPPAFLK